MASFRLDREQWIPVLMADGSAADLSIQDAIDRASSIRRVQGNPLEASVLIRLLLAIAHSVHTPKDEFEWLSTWNSREELLLTMSRYVRAHSQSFDLYDGDRPFAQAPALPAESKSPAVLVYERSRGNNPVFFDGSVVDRPQPISSAAAARALLVLHAYSGSSLGANNPLNNGQKDQMLMGPLCGRLVATIEGANLAETIVLNLASNVQAGIACWAAPPVSKPARAAPTGVADLYTRNSRAVRLQPNEDGSLCTGAAIYLGLTLPDASGVRDPMIPQYASAGKLIDLRLRAGRALWRSAHVLLASRQGERFRPIRALEQLRPLADRGQIAFDQPLRLRTLAVDADAQGPKTVLWRDESLPFGLGVLRQDARYQKLNAAVQGAESVARQCRERIYAFARAFLQDRGESAPDPKEVARLTDELADDLTRFWQEVTPQGERIALDDFDENDWAQALKRARFKTVQEAIDRLPPGARRLRAQYRAENRLKSKAGAEAAT